MSCLWLLYTVAAISLIGLAHAQVDPIFVLFGFQAPDIEGGFNISRNEGNFTTQTSYKYNKCSGDQQKSLKKAVIDATVLAFQGLDTLTVQPGSPPIHYVNFRHETAVDFFGPRSKNGKEQQKIVSKSLRAYATFTNDQMGVPYPDHSRYA